MKYATSKCDSLLNVGFFKETCIHLMMSIIDLQEAKENYKVYDDCLGI